VAAWAADPHTNFAIGTVATAPAPALSGLTLTLTAGQGALFPVGSYNAVCWPPGVEPTAANSEIVRITRLATHDNVTIARAQEGSTAQAIAIGWNIDASITAGTIQAIETEVAALAAPAMGSIYGATGQVIANGAAPALTLGSTDYLLGGMTTASSGLVVPNTGYYECTLQARLNGYSGTWIQFIIFLEVAAGAVADQVKFITPGAQTATDTISLTKTVAATAGQAISALVEQTNNAGAAQTLAASTDNFLQARQVA
jgi:hypothetical protein